jgi:hypothetical protein
MTCGMTVSTTTPTNLVAGIQMRLAADANA